MTVQNLIVKNRYVGNGITTQFPFTFPITSGHKDYIHVYIGNTETTQYSIDLDKKEITLPTPLASDNVLTIIRTLPLYQLLNLVNQGPFFAEDIEASLDDLTYMIQQLNEQLGRTLTLSIATKTDVNTSLPLPEPGKAFGWNGTGTAIINIDNPQDVYYATERIKNDTQAIRDDADDIRTATQAIHDDAANIKSNTQSIRNNTQTIYEQTLEQKKLADNSAVEANAAADKAKALAAQAGVYDAGKTYKPGDVVMTDTGETYRCIAVSVGESPSTSSKWVLVTMVSYETFENDENGDLMPLFNPHNSSNFVIDTNGDIMPAL